MQEDHADSASGSEACSSDCGCRCGMDRRAFVKAAGLGTLALWHLPGRAMAGPFVASDFEKLVPGDKKLSREWLDSLFARGAPQVYEGEALARIGMPVGGICAGQVYLGGDGRLWHWDIFNKPMTTGAEHYANPMAPVSPLDQGFRLKIGEEVRALDASGFAEVRFRGEYPVGIVDYSDPGSPVEVRLEAFSPFVPLNVEDSSLPAIVLRYTVKNIGAQAVDAELRGWLENAVCLYSQSLGGLRRNRAVHGGALSFVESTAVKSDAPVEAPKPDIAFENWDKETYERWTVEGTAFGSGPILKTAIPEYQGDVGGDTERVVNSHASAPGGEVGGKDGATGRLLSKPFTIERRFIRFWIGGGSSSKTCVNLVVDGKAVRTASGQSNNRMTQQSFDVRRLKGATAAIEIVDEESGGWGNVGVGSIVFSDLPTETGVLEELPDFGSMGIGMLGDAADYMSGDAEATLDDVLIGEIGRRLHIEAGQSATVSLVITWRFPNLHMDKLPGGRHYATRFASAFEVAEYVAANFERLSGDTMLWRDTWYDSTLPYWFLDRSFLNTSILATSTCHRFENGRFYGWEGVGCCAGTCGHVWQYAHAVARLFPDLERDTRARVDFGLALQPDGAIFFRGEHINIPAIDAQAGAILRAYREHQMSGDDTFLKAAWPGIQRATEWLIAKDANGDGLIEGNQHNTLDTDWFGPVAWLSGLYLAALRAAEEMAGEAGDSAFAAQCREIFQRGSGNLTARLFDGEYFINQPDPAHADSINSGSGCEIDQVMGQSWAWQVGLGRITPEEQTRSALRSLWRYNFTPDVGPYREANKPGRWYAMPGEAGLLMCTFPRADWNYDKAKGTGAEWAAGYFNECMNGFEYQAAGHMIWEGLVQEGLAVTRAVHDRYDASRRNPWNEVECGDHYARSMASYGVFLAACGFECHGPKGHLGFAPRLTPEYFRAAFTGAEGWGTYSQTIAEERFSATIEIKKGLLRLQSLALKSHGEARGVAATLEGKALACSQSTRDGRTVVTFNEPIVIREGGWLRVVLSART